MAKEPGYVKETLDWCNEQRRLKDKEPLDILPKGKRGDPSSCPCGDATGLYVRTTTYSERHKPNVVEIKILPLPQPVQEFVRSFDLGRLPQYEEEE